MGAVVSVGVLLSVVAPASVFAVAPVVDSFTASSTVVAPGGTVQLTVSAQDPDCASTCTSGCGMTIRSDLTLWTATGGTFTNEDNGVTASPYFATVDWQAPATEDTYTLTVQLSDSGTFVCGGRQTTSAELDILVTATPNEAPVIESLTTVPARLFPGQASALTCTASDPDGDPLTWSWDTDLGSVTPGVPGTATFLAGEPGVATVTCTVTDPLGAPGSDTVGVAVTDAFPAASVLASLGTPQRIAVDSLGDVYAVDRGGLTVVSLLTGETVYRLPLPGVRAVAVDWLGQLLVGDSFGAGVVDSRGALVRTLDPGSSPGDVSDVAVDRVRQRYVVLHRSAAHVAVYDAAGAQIGAIGSNGDDPDQLRRPQGVAVTPGGDIVVADSGHGQIKVFDLAGSLLRAFGDLGGGAGEFVQLDDVAVGDNGVIYASDVFQDWVQTFNPDGTPREVLGTFGVGPGQFMTPAGVAPVDALERLVVSSVNSSSLQVFHLSDAPPALPSPEASLSTESLSFGAQIVGTPSSPQLVSVTNPGSGRLGIQGVDVDRDFTQTGDCDLFVPPGGSCTLSVTFRPLAPGPRVGSLTVDTSSGPAVVTLTGDAVVPATLAVSPTSVSFPDQPVGTVSDPEPVTLVNTGTLPLVLSDVRVSPGFGLVNACAASLPGGTSCVVDVHFAPQAPGDVLPGTLVVESNAGGPVTVPLEGRSVLFDLSVAPDTVDLGRALVDEVSPPQVVVVTNVGGDFAEVGPVTLEGDRPEAFLVQDDPCGLARLEIGEACSLSVVFRPTERGVHAATLRIPSNAGDSPDMVPLLGSAHMAGDTELVFADDFESGDLSAWSMATSPVLPVTGPGGGTTVDVDFGEVAVGSASALRGVSVLNVAAGPLGLGVAEVAGVSPGEFLIQTDHCQSRTLGRGARCGIHVLFVPSAEGATSAEILVLGGMGELLGRALLTGAGVAGVGP